MSRVVPKLVANQRLLAILLFCVACARGSDDENLGDGGSTTNTSTGGGTSSTGGAGGSSANVPGGGGGNESSNGGSENGAGGDGGSTSDGGSNSDGGSTSDGGSSSDGGGGSTGTGGGGPVGEDALILGSSAGTTTNATFTQGSDTILRLVAGGPPCQLSGSPFFTQSHYAYAEVHNPNIQAARVEIGVDPAAGQPIDLPLVAAYSALPTTTAERNACLTGAEIACNAGTAPHESCLTGSDAPTIPAGGSIWIYVGNFATADPSVSFVLSAKILNLL